MNKHRRTGHLPVGRVSEETQKDPNAGLSCSGIAWPVRGPLAVPNQIRYTLNNPVGCPTIGVHFSGLSYGNSFQIFYEYVTDVGSAMA